MTSPQIIAYIVLPLAGYLIGSIPFAWVIGKSKGIDIRTVGSKNIGATNLGRTLGRQYFFYAFLLDAAKGFVPTLAAALWLRYWNAAQYARLPDMFPGGWYPSPPPLDLLPAWAPLLTAAACVLGHVFPLWLKFKGGKGVATSFGVVMGIWPVYTISGLLALLIFIIIFLIYRYISLASIIAAVAFAALATLLATRHNPYLDTYIAGTDRTVFIAVAAAFAGMILWRHRANIGRLLKGTEPQYGQKKRD
jgi:glycerol-3-phosphate acyltransferase PlsY